jgi:hypothetical protein
MTLVKVARFTSVLGAIVWLLGLPLIGVSAALFFSDGSFYLVGALSVLLGLVAAPIALAHPAESGGPSVVIARGLGLVASGALVVTGALLVAGSTGRLGNTAPGWIPGAAAIGLIGFFVWVLVASLSTRHSTTLGQGVFWLGILAGASVLVPTLISVLLFFFDPGYISTNSTIPFDLLLALLTWLSLPIWLIALAVRLQRGRWDQGNVVQKPPAVVSTRGPS